MALVEPVGLAELADDRPACRHLAEDELAHLADILRQRRAGSPVGGGQRFEIERERRAAAETREVELIRGENAQFDGLGVRAPLGGGELVEKLVPRRAAHPAHVLNRAAGAVRAGGELAREEIGAGEKIRKRDLPLPHFVKVRRRDAAAGGAAGLLGEHVDAVILPREIDQPVREIGDERALVDQQARKDGVAFFLQRLRFPPDLSRIGDDTAADAEVRRIADHHARRQQVEFDPARGVARVGAAVYFEHHGNGRAGAAQFFGHFGNKPALAFVAEGNADIGYKLAGEREQGHGCGILRQPSGPERSRETPVAEKGKRDPAGERKQKSEP